LKEGSGHDVAARALRSQLKLRARDDAGTAAALVDMLWTRPLEHWREHFPAIEQLGVLYSSSGAYQSWGSELLRSIGARNPTRLPPRDAGYAVYATLRLLDFNKKSAPPAWIEKIFVQVLWPWMRNALDAGRYGLGLMLETEAYGNYVLHKESSQHFRHAFSIWTDAMREAGHCAGETLLPLSLELPGGAPAIAFYLHSGSVLGHTQILLEFLEAHFRLDEPLIRPLVFVRTEPVSELRDRLAAVEVACMSLEKDVAGVPEPDFHALLALRERISTGQISAVVWVSIAIHMAFAFSMRVAPVQIWWAMKYHSLEFPEIDGYLTNQSAGSTKLVEGKLWRSAPLASEEWYRPQLAGEAIEVRARYRQHALVFGCIGREEKINSGPFLAAVASILEACPHAGFLWTGRERLPAVQSALERAGVAERCHFIGWVDTKLFAQVLDIFLDSFPFPCGFTLYEAMAAGKPVVVYGSTEGAETGIFGLLAPLLSGAVGTPEQIQAANKIFANGELFHCARDEQHYIELALMLASDEAARRAAGDANRTFVREFLSDRAGMARAVGRHLVELVRNERCP
jgi:glycosyltransferase involved in cell wall biosynthesis